MCYCSSSQPPSSPPPSSQVSLRQSTITINAQQATTNTINMLEVQERAARVRAMELENERAELELIRLRRELQDTT